MVIFLVLFGFATLGARDKPSQFESPILAAADKYAQAVAEGRWEEAEAMSSDLNKDLLRRVVVPRIRLIQETFPESQMMAIFQEAQVLDGGLDEILVTERLEFYPPVRSGRPIYLRFHIKQEGEAFSILTTDFVDSPVLFNDGFPQ